MTEQSTGHEAKEYVEVFVVVESNGIVDKWTEVVEKKDTFPTHTVVLGPGWTDNLTGMA